jgi:hypothetical protein
MANDPDKRNPKETPDYVAPSDDVWGFLNQFIGNIGGGGFNDAIAGAQGYLDTQGGGTTVMQLLGRLGDWALGGGNRAADAYKRQGLQATRKAGLEGMNILRGQQGQGGNLGSTIAGVSDATLLSNALGQANQVRSDAEMLRENIQQGRLGLGIQGFSNLGSLLNQERQDNLLASQNIASMIGNQDATIQQQIMQALATQLGLEQDQMNFQMQQWLPFQGQNKPSGLDMLFGGLGTIAPFF